MFAKMAEKATGDVLVLTHRHELLEQTKTTFKQNGIKARFSMILTEANHLGKYPKPKLIIVDEGHLSRSNSWMKVIDYYDTYVAAFTATPVRLDGKPLGDIYEALISNVDVDWLIKHNRLSPYEYYAPTLVETDGLRKVAGDYVVSDLEQLMNERAIYGNVIESYKRFAPGERAICYCVSVEHAIKVAEIFRTNGISAKAISAETPKKYREKIMSDFRNGEITVLCNVGIISEGVSIDEVTCCMLLRPTESIALGIQQMMRCMRYLPGKTAKIIDFVANYTRVGLPDDEREWSLGEPLKRKKQLNENGDFYIRSCPECFMTFKTAPVCPFCGATYPLQPREIKAHEEIELQRITAEETARVEAEKKKARQEQGRADSFEALVQLGKERGYKNPAFWAAQVMRGRKK